jgi:hypothetical protein
LRLDLGCHFTISLLFAIFQKLVDTYAANHKSSRKTKELNYGQQFSRNPSQP